ncbi:MAG: hypothetical protein A3E87_04215 [Gammaproteobacteria bacterium RIFCSPHIGHO2_12_FULL_35_23]|nr:MAG: hypothetical protein A3E87_04215 [Gammaproteobacteria bacterium RIFCSPHIGHO2_12_FULL_35_23]
MADNVYLTNHSFQHSFELYFLHDQELKKKLIEFGKQVAEDLLPLVAENNYRLNLPRLEPYDGIGNRLDHIIHHPSYEAAGEIIYGADILGQFAIPGNMLKSFALLYLSGHAGEAGHNCPLACSAGLVRVLQRYKVPNSEFFLNKLITPSYKNNFTGAQFLTEIQGGSDVGQNAVLAYQDKQGKWRIKGEKWFCSNANADLILMTARYDEKVSGTKGLGLFLVPTKLENGEHNYFTVRRLKEKIGTNSMASGEIDFNEAIAYPVGELDKGFNIVMENVLHISRLFNTIIMLGMVRYAYSIAYQYARHREAFGKTINNYPLVIENLAQIKVENIAGLASILATTKLQDIFDTCKTPQKQEALLLRILANLNKYISALWGVNHIHHCIDVLAGNGAIESFSPLPRLFRDSIVCENWEGTHNTLRLQILRDIHKFAIDKVFINHLQTQLDTLADSPRKKQLTAAIILLNEQLDNLKNLSADLQALHIKTVVNQMSVIYLAVSLLIEALHQQLHTKKEYKLYYYDYFCLLHLQNETLQYDKEYLHLITKIVNED